MALPAYRVAEIPEDDIQKNSRRAALDNWLAEPMGKVAEREQALVKYLTS